MRYPARRADGAGEMMAKMLPDDSIDEWASAEDAPCQDAADDDDDDGAVISGLAVVVMAALVVLVVCWVLGLL